MKQLNEYLTKSSATCACPILCQEYEDNDWAWAHQLEIEVEHYLEEMRKYDEN